MTKPPGILFLQICLQGDLIGNVSRNRGPGEVCQTTNRQTAGLEMCINCNIPSLIFDVSPFVLIPDVTT